MLSLSLANFERPAEAALDFNSTAFNATAVLFPQMEPNPAVLAVLPGVGCMLTFALLQVAAASLVGGSNRRAARELGPSQCAVLLVYRCS